MLLALDILTIDHASLSRPSNVPTPHKTPPTFGRSLRFPHMLHVNFLLISTPCCFAFCGHYLSPRITIVFSLLSSELNFSMPHSSVCLISSTQALTAEGLHEAMPHKKRRGYLRANPGGLPSSETWWLCAKGYKFARIICHHT